MLNLVFPSTYQQLFQLLSMINMEVFLVLFISQQLHCTIISSK